MKTFRHYSVLWFILITVVLSFGTYFLPRPGEQKSLLVPGLMTLIPVMVSVPMVVITEGRHSPDPVHGQPAPRRRGAQACR